MTRARLSTFCLLFFPLRLSILGCSDYLLFFSSPPPFISPSPSLIPASTTTAARAAMYTVRWERNGSKCYDGRTQDVPEDSVVESDRGRGVGECIRIEWGHEGRLWNATVLEKRPAPTPLDLALPAKRAKTAPSCKLLENTTVCRVCLTVCI